MAPTPAEPMRIMLLLRSLGVGGAERQAVMLANELSARGHAITIATFYSGGALEGDLTRDVKLVPLGKAGRGDVIRFGLRLRHVVREHQPDVLYSFLPVPNLMTLLAPRSEKRPKIIWGVRASDMKMANYDWLSRLTQRLEPFFSHRADAVISNSEAGAAHAIAMGMPREIVSIIRNGVDLATFTFSADARERMRARWQVAPDQIVIGHMARWDLMKDHDTFIGALALIIDEMPNLRAVTATPDAAVARNSLRARIDAAPLNGRVRIIGLDAPAPDVMSGFDVFCSSSAYGEGFSNVLCEALAIGLPCVATDVGDARAIVGGAGGVCPPGEPAALAEALLEAVRLIGADRTGTSARSRKRAELFSLGAMADATERLMRRLVS